MAHENFPTGAILTQGLGVEANRGMLTISWGMCAFDLDVGPIYYAGDIVGGSKPMMPGEIANFYKPVPVNENGFPKIPTVGQEPPFYVPADETYDPANIPTLVTVKAKFGKREIQKEFLMPRKKADTLVKVIKFSKSNGVRVKVKNFASMLRKAAIQLKSFGKK